MRKGFTLIELLVVIAIIGVLASIVLSGLNNARKKARDTKRISDVNQIVLALELYYGSHGWYPAASDSQCGGWDTPGDGDFIDVLQAEGLMGAVADPLGDSDCSNYAYFYYSVPFGGCSADKHYYVLGIVDLETIETGNRWPGTPGWTCGEPVSWDEFEWVAGSYEY